MNITKTLTYSAIVGMLLLSGCTSNAAALVSSETESKADTEIEKSVDESTSMSEDSEINEAVFNANFVSQDTEKGWYSVRFPDEQGDFSDDSEIYHCKSGELLHLGYAYLKDTETGALTKVYDPELQYTAAQNFGDYTVTDASMTIAEELGLYMNCVTLEGNMKLVGTVSKDESGFTVDFTDVADLPSLNLGGSVIFKASFGEDSAYYETLKAAAENSEEITLTADEVSIAYKPTFGSSVNWLNFENYSLD